MTPPGRPREFDVDTALDRALELFWRDGYEGASINEIAEAMGVSKPSLYAAFGDKASLYLRALERYAERHRCEQARVLDAEPDARRAVERLLLAAVDSLASPDLPGGCMVVSGSTSCGSAAVPETVRQALCNALRSGANALEARLSRAQKDGQLSEDVDVSALALYFSTVLAGLSVQARGQQCREVLRSVVASSMRAWPEHVVPGARPHLSLKRRQTPSR